MRTGKREEESAIHFVFSRGLLLEKEPPLERHPLPPENLAHRPLLDASWRKGGQCTSVLGGRGSGRVAAFKLSGLPRARPTYSSHIGQLCPLPTSNLYLIREP